MTLAAAELRTLIEHLREQWDIHGLGTTTWHQPAAREGRRFVGSDVARVAAVEGLTRHVHETASSVLLLTEAGQVNSALPLVRLMYECALNAVWLMQSKDDHGIKALLDEHSRNRLAIQRDARQAASQVFRDGADDVADTDREPYAGSLDSTRNFENICKDLSPGGTDAYIFYRLLSSFSHASLEVSEFYYLKALPETPGLPQRRLKPRRPLNPDTLLFFAATSMVWSARAFTYSSHNKAHRSVLRHAAGRLEISAELGLSERYRRRHSAFRKTSKDSPN
jgi:hypothetical protein